MAKAIVVQQSIPPSFRQFLKDNGEALGVHVSIVAGTSTEFTYNGLEFVVAGGGEITIFTATPMSVAPKQLKDLLAAYDLELSKWLGADDLSVVIRFVYAAAS